MAVIKAAINKQDIEPANLREGGTVTAKVNCGRRSLGYVFFHGLIGLIGVRSNSGTEELPGNRTAPATVDSQKTKSFATIPKPVPKTGKIEPPLPQPAASPDAEDRSAAAVQRGLAFLAARQHDDGSYGSEGLPGTLP